MTTGNEPQSVASRPAALAGRDLVKTFGPVTALEGVGFEAHYGRVLALLGDNGAGKSTLIKIMSGVHRPDSGTLLVDGERVVIRNPGEARRMGIATVFQDLAVCELLSITRNVVLGNEPVRRFGPLTLFDPKAANEITTQALAGLGARIDRDFDSFARTLSGGQRQALAIARAMFYGSKCLILDEPTAALAARQAQGVLDHVRSAADAGQAVVLITHNYRQALSVADDVLVLARGGAVGSYAATEVSVDDVIDMVSR